MRLKSGTVAVWSVNFALAPTIVYYILAMGKFIGIAMGAAGRQSPHKQFGEPILHIVKTSTLLAKAVHTHTHYGLRMYVGK